MDPGSKAGDSQGGHLINTVPVRLRLRRFTAFTRFARRLRVVSIADGPIATAHLFGQPYVERCERFWHG